jgi:hypothetical protein
VANCGEPGSYRCGTCCKSQKRGYRRDFENRNGGKLRVLVAMLEILEIEEPVLTTRPTKLHGRANQVVLDKPLKGQQLTNEVVGKRARLQA